MPPKINEESGTPQLCCANSDFLFHEHYIDKSEKLIIIKAKE
jgi:hypothetical protein